MSDLAGVQLLTLRFLVVSTDPDGYRTIRAAFVDRIEAERAVRSMRREWGNLKKIDLIEGDLKDAA